MRALRQHLRQVVPVVGGQVLGAAGVGIGAEGGDAVEDAGVADIGAVSPSAQIRRHMPVHPRHQEAAIAAARGVDGLVIGPALRQQPVGGGLDVLQFQLALAADQAVAEVEPEAAAAVVVDLRDDVPRGGKDVRVPAPGEGVAGRRKGPAVDDVGDRVLLLRVEARREHQPHLHRLAQRAGHADFAHLAEVDIGQQTIVEMLQPPRRPFGHARHQARRVRDAVGGHHQHAGREVEALHPAASMRHDVGLGCQLAAPEVAAAALF